MIPRPGKGDEVHGEAQWKQNIGAALPPKRGKKKSVNQSERLRMGKGGALLIKTVIG